MAEYIDREAVMSDLKTRFTITLGRVTKWSELFCYNKTIEALRNAPTADVAEVRYGYWKDNTNGTFTCTACGCRASKMKYCGHCGAKMLGVAMTKSRYDELVRQGLIKSDRLYFTTEERKDSDSE